MNVKHLVQMLPPTDVSMNMDHGRRRQQEQAGLDGWTNVRIVIPIQWVGWVAQVSKGS